MDRDPTGMAELTEMMSPGAAEPRREGTGRDGAASREAATLGSRRGTEWMPDSRAYTLVDERSSVSSV